MKDVQKCHDIMSSLESIQHSARAHSSDRDSSSHRAEGTKIKSKLKLNKKELKDMYAKIARKVNPAADSDYRNSM